MFKITQSRKNTSQIKDITNSIQLEKKKLELALSSSAHLPSFPRCEIYFISAMPHTHTPFVVLR